MLLFILQVFTFICNSDSLDWKPDISKAEIMDRVRRKISCGSIILFHNDTAYTAKILPDIIKECKEAGFKFIPVSELILKDNYIIDSEGRQRTK
jgi:pyruvate-formate lyase-activating enzyme